MTSFVARPDTGMEAFSIKPRSVAAGLLCFYIVTSKALVSCTGDNCPSGIFCGGECLPDNKICDGIQDCLDGSDELTCVSNSTSIVCKLEQFLCPSTAVLCVSFAKICDGINDCPDGFDESSCTTIVAGQSCLSSQFQCVSDSICVPLAYRCDQIGQCSDGSDEKNCMSPRVLAPPPPSINASAGSSLTLSCLAAGTPPPFVTWLKDLQPLASSSRFAIQWKEGNGTLNINPVRLQDSGEYSCSVSSSTASFLAQPRTTLTVNDSNPFTCQDAANNMYVEGSVYYDKRISTSGLAATAAADVVFVVDESGSMSGEHSWLRAVVQQLQSSLEALGVGIGERANQYALVGFAAPDITKIAGHLLTDFTSPARFMTSLSELSLDGSYEDGYSGMVYALDHVSVRVNTSRIMILITDEDRSVLDPMLTNDIIGQRLEEAGFVLNVVVNQGFLTGSSSFALGVGQNSTAYLYDDTRTSLYSTVNGDIQYPPYYSYGNTFHDYVELALQLNGAAWDINQLRLGGAYSDAFTNSFVNVKVAEVMSVYRTCLVCSCLPPKMTCSVNNASFAACSGPVVKPAVVSVSPSFISAVVGSSVIFECVATQRRGLGSSLAYAYSWTYPDQTLVTVVGSNLTVHNVTLESEGMYTCTVNNQSSSGLLDVLIPPSIVATSGNVMLELSMLSSVNLSCNVSGVPRPYVHFVRQDGQPVSSTAVTGIQGNMAILTIRNFYLSDVGEYLCIANSIAGEAMDSIKVSISQCILDGNDTILLGRSKFVLKTHQTADVILLVDESGSMSMEHRWIPNMVIELDGMLRKLGIGNSTRNRFGVVGFGGNCRSEESAWGTVYSVNNTQLFYSSDDIYSIVESLQDHSGQVEDGYSAVETALKSYALRNASRLFILITDEDRSILNANLTQSYIQDALRKSNIVLNAAVAQRLYSGELRAIGIDVNQTAYVFDPSSPTLNRMFEGKGVSVPPDGGYGRTREDYSQLAWGSGGAVWDLGLLRLGGPVTEAFTNAFVEANVREIVAQTETCLNCSCTIQGLSCVEVSTSFCHPPPTVLPSLPELPVTFSCSDVLCSHKPNPAIVALDAGQTASLLCEVALPATLAWTFEGGPLPNNTYVQTVAANSSRLMVVSATLDNEGAYTCIGHSSDSLVNIAGVVNLEVYGPLDLFLSLVPRELAISRGCDASIQCQTKESATFVWFFNYDALPANVQPELDGSMFSTLSVLGTSPGNQGLYTCVASSVLRSVSSSSTSFLNVIDPPLQMSVENPFLHVLVGGAAILKCKVQQPCPGLKPAFQWTRHGMKALSSQAKIEMKDDETVLKLNNVTRDDDGMYYCHTALYSSAAESAIELRVDELPVPIIVKVTSLQSLPVPVGSPVRFLCEASANTVSLYWTYNGEIVSRGSVNSHFVVRNITNSSSLFTIYDTVLSDTGTLTCLSDGGVSSNPVHITIGPQVLKSSVASSPFSKSVRYAPTDALHSGTPLDMATILPAAAPSPTATSTGFSMVSSLKVSDAQMSSISISASPVPLQISLFPSEIKLKAGQSAKLLCEATSVVVLTWSFRYTAFLPENVEVVMEGPTKSSLTIHNMTADNSGDYMCGTTGDSSNSLYGITAVTFLETITIEVVPDKDVLVVENGSTTFTCTLTCGCSGTQLTWQRGGSVLPSTVLYSGRKIVLYLENVKKSDEGAYTCVATNGLLGMTGVDVHLKVNATSSILPLLPTVFILPGVLSVSEGLSANFTCKSSQPAEFVWSFNVVAPLPGNVEVQNVTSTVSVLKVVGAGLTNAGSYYCKATFAGGQSAAAYADLIFIEMLKVKIQSASPLNVSNGTALSVICSLDCSCGGARLSWNRAGYQLLPSSAAIALGNSGRSLTLSFPVVTTDIGGEYICMASSDTQPPANKTLLLRVF